MEIRSDILDKRRVLDVIVAMLNGHYVPRFDHPGMEERFGIKAARRGKEEFLRTLRRLVDQWIDSGKSGPDRITDSPQDRDMHQVPPGYERPLFAIRADWLGRNPPRWMLNRNGLVDVSNHPPPFDPLDLDAGARDQAGYYLEVLLDSPARERLSRCDDCRSYFVRARAPKRNTPIYHGTFCQDCKGKGGARRTIASREQRHQEKIGWAAAYWPKWKQARHHPRQSEWIAKQVNRKLVGHNHDPITGKWVTQNKKEIENEVERRKHAKG
jgi:hypothetical protein